MKKRNYSTTRVIYRYDKGNGIVIAFFPETWNKEIGYLMSYEVIGQHSDCPLCYYQDTIRVPEEKLHEQFKLEKELEKEYGEGNLLELQKFNRKNYE